MATTINPPPSSAAEVSASPRHAKYVKDVIKDTPWRLLDKAAESPKFAMLATLGTVGWWAYEAEAKGHTKEMTPWLRHMVESGAHPALGFTGAWLGHMAAKLALKHEVVTERYARPLTLGAVALGMTAANFSGEIWQGIITKTNFDFAHHRFETGKDFLAAFVIGGGIYGIQNWWLKRQPKTNAHTHDNLS
jgi:hypothetical protein